MTSLTIRTFTAACLSGLVLLAAPVGAQTGPEDASAQAPDDSLAIFFRTGSARVDADQQQTLDQAARLFREGSPIVMIVSGGADTVGDATRNLDLSIRRAQQVADGLVARGIPAERLQVLGRGNSELPVETADGVDQRLNRQVEITWR
ncbi:OmpA family protein [Pseudoroseicyclus aestuarii]|uniref:OmpA family protein n=1 Tax=Pseudoroseicyclus aestuarii TaxID=1795041 RepID=A0A318SQE3_9RHOB|nr:OmpA family protein [Pseudoroseicyclus aestuarii]PYE84101.1 OmpA family protein [Pseudoroseicyclus aestuarii]